MNRRVWAAPIWTRQTLAELSFALAPLETLLTRPETSAGGLPEVDHGEDASWGMKRGTRRGDVKFAHGSFRRCYLYGVASDASSATMEEFWGCKKTQQVRWPSRIAGHLKPANSHARLPYATQQHALQAVSCASPLQRLQVVLCAKAPAKTRQQRKTLQKKTSTAK